MAKVKTKWVCQNCGYETAKYLGKCPDCLSWGSIVEEEICVVNTKTSSLSLQNINNNQKPEMLSSINFNQNDGIKRQKSGIEEFDRVTGGGLVLGSLNLIAGDPGIGKSTLLLQVCSNLAKNGLKLLYVSAEESAVQIKLRANRLNIDSDNLYIFSNTNFELIEKQVNELKPDILIIDSIQTIYKLSLGSVSGTVSQIKECTLSLMQIAKTLNITTIIVGHVTKDGNIAGPKILEHMVDSVFYFEGDKYKSYRMLRCNKNRFGATDELGMFEMEEFGLRQILNPSELFLNKHQKDDKGTSGSVVVATNDGNRPLLVEIESLVGITPYPSPRRVANGEDYNRVLQILAVLEKRVGLNLSKQDVYVNVSGGLNIYEPASDLGIAVAILTCAYDIIFDHKTVLLGEIALSGDIKNVTNIEKRILEAQKLGFSRIIIPKQQNKKFKDYKIKIVEVEKLKDVVKLCIQKKKVDKT